MTTISALTPETSSGSSDTQAAINDNFDLFVSLLATQAQNQDPLDPMDSAEYTNQLVQYSMVEQQMLSNEKLDEQLVQLKTQSASQFVNYIGQEVTAHSAASQLEDGSASWNLKSERAGNVSVKIKNEDGAVVYSEDIEVEEGDNPYTWDGVGTNGAKLPDGAYSLELVPVDEAGEPFTVQSEVTGKVDAVDFSTGEVILEVGDVSIPVGNVTNIKEIPSS